MNLTRLKGGPGFWDGFAPWYEKWIERGEYHRPLVGDITQMIEPGWKVLDIGAATGALSVPLASLGCDVTALEPSEKMRAILKDKIKSLRINNIDIRNECWEDFPLESGTHFDLIIACNSLHLTKPGMINGMIKVFSAGADYVCLATEVNQGIAVDFKDIDRMQNTYNFLYIRNYALNSSFYFDDMDEAAALGKYINERIDVSAEGDRTVQRDRTDVAVVWWEKK